MLHLRDIKLRADTVGPGRGALLPAYRKTARAPRERVRLLDQLSEEYGTALQDRGSVHVIERNVDVPALGPGSAAGAPREGEAA